MDNLRTAAQALFDTYVLAQHSSPSYFRLCYDSGNIWRVAWAYDTINDYFSIFPEQATTATIRGDGAPLFEQITKTYFNAERGGDWWDDYGWLGIAALRAANSGLYDGEDETDESRKQRLVDVRQTYVKMAINACCYMYGQGWEEPGKPPRKPFRVPFPDIVGWKQLLDRVNKKDGDIGAPNVYQWIERNDIRPEYAGGIWNARTTSQEPVAGSEPGHSGGGNSLLGIQNTVTNGLFAVLSLRLCRASHDSRFAELFEGIDVRALFGYWCRQMGWFDDWFDNSQRTDPRERLKWDLDADNGLLVCERAPKFASGLWNVDYYPNLVWTGDQGIMMGALMDLELARADPECWVGDLGQIPELPHLFPASAIARGVSSHLYGEKARDYLLQPWGRMEYYNNKWVAIFDDFGPGDDPDYRTGCAVFYRYLGQMLEAGKIDASSWAPRLAKAATYVADLADPTVDGSCRCYRSTEGTSSPCNEMTRWINRLALICTAIKFSLAAA